jgi:hypothetical protein
MKILIACFPKSGSSYLSALVGNLPGFSVESYVPYYGRREQELSEALIESKKHVEKQVSQHHVRASGYTTHLIELYGLTPIVLVRNIYDAIVSLSDHMANESPVFPSGYFDDRIAGLAVEDRINAVIDLAVPWYINFYVSWWHARPGAIVTYEDLILGGPERQTEYLQSVGVDTDLETVSAACGMTEKQSTRFNVGKSGRGRMLVDQFGRQRIERLVSYYPDVDFSKIGIDGTP